MGDFKVRGREVFYKDVWVATIHGSRDPSGKRHEGYWLKFRASNQRYGFNEKSQKGCWAYFADAKRYIENITGQSDLYVMIISGY